MKIRSGFVSNSSSSSFILSGSYKEIVDAVESMVNLVNDDFEGGSPDHLEGFQTFKNNMEHQEDFKEGDIGVAFTSTNYDTYIRVYHSKGDVYSAHIETCNNHDWESVVPSSLMKDMYSEDSVDYDGIHRTNREIGSNFIWLSERCIVRSAEHYLYFHKKMNFKCACEGREKVSSVRFDEELKARCAQCDALINEKPIKRKKLNSDQEHPDNIIGGIF